MRRAAHSRSIRIRASPNTPRSVWTQQHGLPQDTIRAIAQTTDGYLWLGTDEGLARFDGYDFTVFNKANGDLPSNSITALAAAPDGSLWIGTTDGLTRYRDERFRTLHAASRGLPDNAIGALYIDHTGALWIVAGVDLSRFENGKFTNFRARRRIARDHRFARLPKTATTPLGGRLQRGGQVDRTANSRRC